MTTFRLVVRSAQGDVSQGTAWAVAPGRVCTAFHVVGHCADRSWMHQLIRGATYWIEAADGPLALEPLVFDAQADLALLGCAGATGPELPLAQSARKNVRWTGRGYPGFHAADPFALTGRVVDLREAGGARGIQVSLDQGAQADWGGISGAAILDESQARVIGAITQVTEGTATAWGAPVEALHGLLALADLAARAARAEYGPEPVDAARNAYCGVDRQRLVDALDRLARARPGDGEVAALHAALDLEAQARATALEPALAARLREDYDVIAVREGGRIIRPVAAREFAEVLASAKNFGGRRGELTKLDRFLDQAGSGYFFVTGSAGFGKTSLLAYWIEALRRRGDATCFHFFTGRVQESLDPEHAFRRLAEQLLAAHELGGELPRDRIRLQALYVDLLALPAPDAGPLVIVLDGLDEGLETVRPSAAMFPEQLGEGVFVVFSARKTADCDWLEKLGLRLEGEAQIDLGSLDRGDLAEIVARAGVAVDAALLDRLQEKTSGDPFYVGDVLRVLAKAGGALAVLDDLPASHSAYLDGWWKEALRRVAQPGFVDLMGTLAALRAPLAARDLAAISKEDQLSNASIGVLLEEVARYVDDDRAGRYWLRHGRIRQFVRDTLGDDMATYDERVLAFAERWNDPKLSIDARGYGRRHLIAHLLAAERFAQALDVLDADFIAARWREDGSYAPLLGDLDRMLDWLLVHPNERLPMCHALALAVTRESARDLMRNLPTPLCRAWVRADGYDRVQEMLASLPSHRGEARDPLLAVAAEMLDLAPAGDAGAADRDVAADLLARTIGLLPLVRTDAWAFEAYERVCGLLQTAAFSTEQAQALLRQTLAFASQLPETQRELKAACLARLASAALPWDRDLTARLVDNLEACLPALQPGDQAVARAQALPALRELAPPATEGRVEALFEELAWKPGQAALSRAPVMDLLSAWAPAPDAHRAIESLLAARERDEPWRQGRTRYYLDPHEFRPALLLRLGFAERAWDRVRREAASATPDFGLLADAWDEVPEWRPQLLPLLAALPTDFPTKPGLARVLAQSGRWSELRALLDTYDGKQLADIIQPCFEATLAHAPSAARDDAIAFLEGAARRLALDDIGECQATIALALVRADHARARAALATAMRSALSKLPEGDADQARELAVIGLSAERSVQAAVEVARGCQWWHMQVSALLRVLRLLPTDAAERPELLAQIAELMRADPDSTFIADVVDATCDTAMALGTAAAAEGRALLDAAEEGVQAMRFALTSDRLKLLARLQRTRVRFDPERAARTGARLAPWIVRMASGGLGEDTAHALLGSLYSLTVGVIESGAATPALFDHVLEWARDLPLELSDRVVALSLAGAAAAPFDPPRGAALFGEAVGELAAFKHVAAHTNPDGLYFRKLFDDLVGTVHNDPWMSALQALLGELSASGMALAAATVSTLLEQAWSTALELADDAPALRSAGRVFLTHIARLPTALTAIAVAAAARIATDLEAHRGRLDVDDLLGQGVEELAGNGQVDAARGLAERIGAPDRREAAAERIELFAELPALADRTPMEQALLNLEENKGVSAALVGALRAHEFEPVLTALIEVFRDRRVRYALFDWAPYLVATVMQRWDPMAGKAVVDAVAELDQRLVTAAARIAVDDHSHPPARRSG